MLTSSKDEPYKYEKGCLEDIDNIEEVDFQGEFLCSWEETERVRKKNNLLKEQLIEIKGSPKVGEEEDFRILRREIDQDRVVEEHLIGRIKEMEDENFHLRNELGEALLQFDTKSKFADITPILEDIFNSQRSPYDRNGLSYHGKEYIIKE